MYLSLTPFAVERKPLPPSHNLYFTLCRSRKLFNIFYYPLWVHCCSPEALRNLLLPLHWFSSAIDNKPTCPLSHTRLKEPQSRTRLRQLLTQVIMEKKEKAMAARAASAPWLSGNSSAVVRDHWLARKQKLTKYRKVQKPANNSSKEKESVTWTEKKGNVNRAFQVLSVPFGNCTHSDICTDLI